jgi:hypothetical protein
VLLDGLLVVLTDDEPTVGPGAAPSWTRPIRPTRAFGNAKVRAQTPARLALLSRHQLDNDTLLDVASEQGSALRALLERRPRAEPER